MGITTQLPPILEYHMTLTHRLSLTALKDKARLSI